MTTEVYMGFGTIEQAIDDIRAGKFVVVADDEDRENEGDLICAAELITPEMVNFMIKRAGGMICVGLTGERTEALGLSMMAKTNLDDYRTAYTVTIDAAPKFGVTTGISAADRAKTIRVAIDPSTTRADLRHGGHVNPLRARDGGVLQRVGHTEAAVDLARLAGLRPAGVLCEIVNDDGTMKRLPDLVTFAAEHGLTLISIADLIAYRRRFEKQVEKAADARIPTRHGAFRAVGYRS